MAKACVVNTGTFGTEASVGLPAIFAQAVAVAVTFTPHQNPDKTQVKDTRS